MLLLLLVAATVVVGRGVGGGGPAPGDNRAPQAVDNKLRMIPVILEELTNLTTMNRQDVSRLFRLAGLQMVGEMLMDQLNASKIVAGVGSTPVVSAQCLSDLVYLLGSIKRATEPDLPLANYGDSPTDHIAWSLKVVDSFGKVPTGLLHGNVWMLGSFDQCVGISVAKEEEGRLWKGQYCRYDVRLFHMHQMSSESSDQCRSIVPLKYGVCVPASCNLHDMQLLGHIANKTLGGIACSFDVVCRESRDSECPSPVGTDAAQTSVKIFLVITLTMLVFGTAYDFFVINSRERRPRRLSNAGLLKLDQAVEKNKSTTSNKNPHASEASSEEQCFFVKLFLAFSLYSNAKRVLSTTQASGQITCFHGIRVLSMFWIIFGHTYYWAIQYLNNLVDAYKLPDNVFNQVLLNGSLSVDSFLFLSGSLLSFLWLKKMKHNQNRLKSPQFWLQYIFHRYLRVTPVYLIVLVIYAVMIPKLYDGPMWERCSFNGDRCDLSWWTNVLYVNNFFNLDYPCMTWSWYLALDMQFFVFSSPLLILFLKNEIIAVLITMMLICISAAIQIAYRVVNPNWPPIAVFSVNPKQFNIINIYWETIYVKPYTRCGPFLVGLLFGYYMHKTKLTKSLSKTFAIAGWLLCTVIGMAVIFGLREYSRSFQISHFGMLLYAGFGRTIWAAVLAWVSFACTTGYGGLINNILSWNGWIPLSRLCYCLYLVHPILIQTFYASQSKPIHFSGHYQMVHYFFGHLFLSIALAFCTSLSFEWPVQRLEQLILFDRPKQPTACKKDPPASVEVN